MNARARGREDPLAFAGLGGRAVFCFPELGPWPRVFHLFAGKGSGSPGREREERELLPHPFTQERIVRLRQVHGTRVVSAMRSDGGAPRGVVEADGAYTDEPGLLLSVGVADCLPVYLVEPDRPLVALLHAGWRGLAGGMIEAALGALEAHGAPPARLLAAVGPSIGPCCYEVGEEVAGKLGKGALPRVGPSGRPHVDLFGDVRERLLAAGVSEERMAARPPCTSCSFDRFHSHRRSGGLPGRNDAFLAILP